jgi:hypothetical protein
LKRKENGGEIVAPDDRNGRSEVQPGVELIEQETDEEEFDKLYPT